MPSADVAMDVVNVLWVEASDRWFNSLGRTDLLRAHADFLHCIHSATGDFLFLDAGFPLQLQLNELHHRCAHQWLLPVIQVDTLPGAGFRCNKVLKPLIAVKEYVQSSIDYMQGGNDPRENVRCSVSSIL